jgi:hypothetical protein
MAIKIQNAARRVASRTTRVAVDDGWRARVHKPTETDPKKREAAIDRAASRIKTTARIDTLSSGRD